MTNPSIPVAPCFRCAIPTDETQSVYGVGHYKCFLLGTLKKGKEMTDQELEKLFKDRSAESLTAALRAVFDAGATEAMTLPDGPPESPDDPVTDSKDQKPSKIATKPKAGK